MQQNEFPAFDATFVRSSFPALDPAHDDWVLADNAGGSVPAGAVVERTRDYMARHQVQLGASYARSLEAKELVEAGRQAAAQLVNASPEEVVIGHSSTLNAQLLARSLRPLWSEGDEIVVTNLDHETNIGPWRALESSGIVIREWDLRANSASLEPEDLEPLLGPRTRLVAFTHCANIVGGYHDVADITQRVHRSGALVAVDGVAFAPHARVDVRGLDVDFYFVSLYKTFGPHLGLLFVRRELLERLESQNHFFVGQDAGVAKLEPGNITHELAAGLPGILDYWRAFDQHHFGPGPIETPARLERSMALAALHESSLVEPLIRMLAEHADVRLLGPHTADPERRAPTLAFTSARHSSREVVRQLEEQRIGARFGHFYALRGVRALGLDPEDGVVRISLAHTNTTEEVERILAALEQIL